MSLDLHQAARRKLGEFELEHIPDAAEPPAVQAAADPLAVFDEQSGSQERDRGRVSTIPLSVEHERPAGLELAPIRVREPGQAHLDRVAGNRFRPGPAAGASQGLGQNVEHRRPFGPAEYRGEREPVADLSRVMDRLGLRFSTGSEDIKRGRDAQKRGPEQVQSAVAVHRDPLPTLRVARPLVDATWILVPSPVLIHRL